MSSSAPSRPSQAAPGSRAPRGRTRTRPRGETPGEQQPTAKRPVRSSSSTSGGMSTFQQRKAGGPKKPMRKMVIKPFKVKPKLPDNFEAEAWGKLSDAVHAIFHQRAVGHSLEELYKSVESLCLHKMGRSTYSKLKMECDSHIREKITVLQDQTPDAAAFLQLMERAWTQHCEEMLTIRSVFLYLDRRFVMQQADTVAIWELGMQLFRCHLHNRSEVEQKTVQGILTTIERERCGESVPRSLLKNLLQMLHSLHMYDDFFQEPFLHNTRAFYEAEGKRYMQQTEVAVYLRHAETRLTEETERVLHYLHASTRVQLIAAVEQELLVRHCDALIERGMDDLLENMRIDDLARMYRLLARVKRVDGMREAFGGFIKKVGRTIVMDQEKDATMVTDLLAFKAKMDRVASEAFGSNDVFMLALKMAFESFINTRKNKPAELIAKFIDKKLRIGNRGASDEELEMLLDDVMTLFRYIQGKDIFEAFYKRDLAKRLLLGKSASVDAEKSIINKLKTECGAQFTKRAEGMFRDVDLSEDIMINFKQHMAARRADGGAHGTHVDVDMNVNVLTAGYWPSYPSISITLPPQLSLYQQQFKEFYLKKHSGRRLQWQHSLGQCVLKARFPKCTKELSVSLFQAIILLLFNNAPTLTFADIADAVQLEDKELRRTLQSLACGKVRVIQKVPRGRDVADTDKFVFNVKFVHKLVRIKINQIQMKETKEEQSATTQRVFQDRIYQVDAAIVRTMKARKRLSHALLVAELFKQLKFPFKPSDIKKRIESLIDREYLKRDENNTGSYEYLA